MGVDFMGFEENTVFKHPVTTIKVQNKSTYGTFNWKNKKKTAI